MPCAASRLFVCAVCAAAITAQAAEADATGACPTLRAAPLGARPVSRPPPAEAGPTYLRADSVRSLSENVIELRGDAEVVRDGERISADYLRYHRADNYVEAPAGATVTQPGDARFTTAEARLDLDTRVGEAGAGSYSLAGRGGGRGDVGRVEFLDRDRTRLHDARYTTCPAGREDWFLRARRLDLDTAADVGVARHVTLDFLGVPVLYLPYLRFPISDERKSGFLFPQLGYGSRLGTVVAAPYYWNIAPNYDATLTPRWMTRRGVQLQGEFRYLGYSSNGRLDAEYLPSDNLTGDDRAAGTYVHNHVFTPRWSASVNLRRVSDQSYVSDFGDRLSITSETHLPQNAQLDYRGPIWAFTARASDYQTIDRTIAPGNRPYARLPQLLLTASHAGTDGAHYRFDGELVNFQRDAGVTGQRLNVSPSVRLPLTPSYGFLVPEVGVRHIAYSLEQTSPERPSVTAPFASLDAGLYFDRSLRLRGARFEHTLEPRLYYLYVPHRSQDDQPNFDTSVPEFTFANLFRNSRFAGGDRIGDANQLTMALTTRLIDADGGAERLRASIGRIHYFDERRINLPAGTAANANSDIAAEAVAWLPGNVHVRAATQWAPDQDRTMRGNLYLQHQPAPDKIVNVGYRYTRNELRQLDVSAEWPLTARWILRGRSLYSLRDVDRGNIDSFIGVEYRSCCWALRLYGRRGLVQTAAGSAALTEQRRHVLLEFELAGLSRSESKLESPLRQGLFTFPPDSTR